jgi:hypothetical protein
VGRAAFRPRLRALYRDRAELLIDLPPGGGTRATIKLPYEVSSPRTSAP